jgi:hypothetical protein
MGNYIIKNGELMHWGVPGMKWGIRRYQNKDGTLTEAGKKRYDKEMEKAKAAAKIVKNRERTQAKMDKLNALRADTEARKKALDGKDDSNLEKTLKSKAKAQKDKKRTIKELSNEELQAKIDRMNLENRYRDLMKQRVPQQPPKKGKGFVSEIFRDSAKNIGTQTAVYVMGTIVNKAANKVFKSPDISIVNRKQGQQAQQPIKTLETIKKTIEKAEKDK